MGVFFTFVNSSLFVGYLRESLLNLVSKNMNLGYRDCYRVILDHPEIQGINKMSAQLISRDIYDQEETPKKTRTKGIGPWSRPILDPLSWVELLPLGLVLGVFCQSV